jgi:hypothetical protein
MPKSFENIGTPLKLYAEIIAISINLKRQRPPYNIIQQFFGHFNKKNRSRRSTRLSKTNRGKCGPAVFSNKAARENWNYRPKGAALPVSAEKPARFHALWK